VFAASVVTAITAQNTVEVRKAMEIPLPMIRAQLEAVFDDLDIAAAKTGMLSSSGVIETVAAFLRERGFTRLVVDPVMISKSGYRLLAPEAVDTLERELLPLALVATPNLHEAAHLTGRPIESVVDMEEAARRIADMGPRAVLVKGGHAPFSPGTDVLFDGSTTAEFRAGVVTDGTAIHGTGCTLSAAIAARLALGESIAEAVTKAKHYVTRAIAEAPAVGSGHPPGHHFYFIDADTFRR
jgi:hydroxymethylpyrimidine/phosphomethylpyrimidine kinase